MDFFLRRGCLLGNLPRKRSRPWANPGADHPLIDGSSALVAFSARRWRVKGSRAEGRDEHSEGFTRLQKRFDPTSESLGYLRFAVNHALLFAKSTLSSLFPFVMYSKTRTNPKAQARPSPRMSDSVGFMGVGQN
jgi:hypothetical protein